MKTDAPQTIYLRDYTPPAYQVEHVNMYFELYEDKTIVRTDTYYMRAESAAADSPLTLNGEHLKLVSVHKDEQPFEEYALSETTLTIENPGEKFSLSIVTEIDPAANTALEGLYKSGGNYCTQCEAEGFRRITYYQDRPDVLSTFSVRIEADKAAYPVLLSNGDLMNEGDLESEGRHFAVFNDATPKPCYLFALVAGDLECVQDSFTTMSGQDVDLRIYVRAGDEAQCDHAMESLKKSMKWDEDVYGREYQYKRFNIVAVSDFNMGAMENTSLNIFNTALVLAEQQTATDTDFLRVESVIAHEYFHNWSGNRVTCRDWFQLSLKEGLTVFRDQEFSADLNSRTVQRIDDVTHLRRYQFPEDAGPLAHPIRPDNYIEINNFYTMTVYEKGAEVIRMLYTIVGPENYRKGTDLYFDRHDGQAVTCEDWIKAHEDASAIDLAQFCLWYSQAGTPKVTFKGEYDEEKGCYEITLSQHTPPTPNQPSKEPMHIPVAVGFIGRDETDVLHLTEAEQTFTFDGFDEKPVPSVLRGFSAPVTLISDQSNADLTYLMLNDTDGFNRWEAGQQLYLRMLNHMIDEGSKDVCPKFMDAIGVLIESGFEKATDKALLARALILPSISYIGQSREQIDPDAIHKARQAFLATIKRTHRKALDKLYKSLEPHGDFEITPEAMGARDLRNVVLGLLSATNGTGCAKLAKAHYDDADNMTDRIAALSRLADNPNEQRKEAFDDFYARFKDYPLVVDKYFALQASASRKDLTESLKKLKQHPDFKIKNPNRVRSLYSAFAMNNPVAFHAASGAGYTFLADSIIELNEINPQIAARLLTPMREWKRYTSDRQKKMKAELKRILATPNLAPDIFEIASKSLK